MDRSWADAQYQFCSLALGLKSPAPDIEHTKNCKADLVAALNTAFAYCDKAYDGMTDATAVQAIKLFGNDAPRLSALTVNNMHDLEYYGNLVTYMRMKNIVPPSSEQQQPSPQPPNKVRFVRPTPQSAAPNAGPRPNATHRSDFFLTTVQRSLMGEGLQTTSNPFKMST